MAGSERVQRVSNIYPKPTATETSRVLGGRYALERQIDAGGTATIHRALDLATGELCAVKILNEVAMAEPILIDCFRTGARAAMSIEHQNVVRIRALHEPENDRPYAVMELLDGEPLHAVVAREVRLAPELCVSLARGAARGLHAAHAAGVVHCDVKPENLFVIEAHGGPTLKILDFDLASVADLATTPEEPPDERLILRGTAKYMAPEQIVGDPVDARTDVYALGVVLFRLLTGHLPFDLELGTTLLRHQLLSPVPPPSWLVDGLDPRLDTVVFRATRKDPEKRYADMSRLIADLDSVSLGRELPLDPSEKSPDRYAPRTERAEQAVRALESAA